MQPYVFIEDTFGYYFGYYLGMVPPWAALIKWSGTLCYFDAGWQCSIFFSWKWPFYCSTLDKWQDCNSEPASRLQFHISDAALKKNLLKVTRRMTQQLLLLTVATCNKWSIFDRYLWWKMWGNWEVVAPQRFISENTNSQLLARAYFFTLTCLEALLFRL